MKSWKGIPLLIAVALLVWTAAPSRAELANERDSSPVTGKSSKSSRDRSDRDRSDRDTYRSDRDRDSSRSDREERSSPRKAKSGSNASGQARKIIRQIEIEGGESIGGRSIEGLMRQYGVQ